MVRSTFSSPYSTITVDNDHSPIGGLGSSRPLLWDEGVHPRSASGCDNNPEVTTGRLLERPTPGDLQCAEPSASSGQRSLFPPTRLQLIGRGYR